MRSEAEALINIVRKTIAGVVILSSMRASPWEQLFIVYTDNTYLEFYGDPCWAKRLEVGDLETVEQYSAQFGGIDEAIY